MIYQVIEVTWIAIFAAGFTYHGMRIAGVKLKQWQTDRETQRRLETLYRLQHRVVDNVAGLKRGLS